MATGPDNDILGAFATEEDRKQLTDAILECTRQEVQRTLFELVARHSSGKDAAPLSSPAQQEEFVSAAKPSTSTGARPIIAHRSSSASALLESSPLYKPKISVRPLSSRPMHVPLEIDVSRGSKLDRSSFKLLEKSADIVTEATGRSLKIDLFDNNEDDTTCSDDRKAASPKRVESWHAPSKPLQPKSHVSFQPTETARLIRTSPHSIAHQNALRLSTTALQRRKPQLSTIASERNQVREIGKRLLGPITLESKPSSWAIPNSLPLDDWENELARNIISLFSNKVRSDLLKKQSDPAIGGLFENDNESDHTGDFQRISISRCQSFSLDAPEEVPQPRMSQVVTKGRQEREPSSTFRLKMIWMTGTGMVSDWQVLRGKRLKFFTLL